MADTADPSGVFASGVRMERHRRGGQGGHHHKKPSTKAPEELLDYFKAGTVVKEETGVRCLEVAGRIMDFGCKPEAYDEKKLMDVLEHHNVSLHKLMLSGCEKIEDSTLPFLKFCTELRELNLNGCDKVSNRVLEGVAANCHTLRALGLRDCVDVQDEPILELARQCKHLTALDLSRCIDITDKSISAIAKGCHHLTSLYLSECGQLTTASIKLIGQNARELKHLDVKGNVGVSDSSISNIGRTCTKLELLNLADCDKISDTSIGVVGQRCSNLLYLNLRNCHEVTDWSMADLARRCNQITFLDLAFCKDISDEVVELISNGCGPRLTYLDLRKCDRITDKAGALLGKCVKLKHLSLLKCTQLTEETLLPVAQNCLNLELLHMRKSRLSDPGLQLLGEQQRDNGATLTALDLGNCTFLTDKSVQEIMHCHLLIKLNLRKAFKTTDLSLRLIPPNCRKLQQLNLSYCKNIHDKTVYDLGMKCPDMVHLDLSWCPAVTDWPITKMAERFKKLKHLDIGQCPRVTSAIMPLFERLGVIVIRSPEFNPNDQVKGEDRSLETFVENHAPGYARIKPPPLQPGEELHAKLNYVGRLHAPRPKRAFTFYQDYNKIDLVIKVKGNPTTMDINVEFSPLFLKVTQKDVKKPYINGTLVSVVDPKNCVYALTGGDNSKQIEITLRKKNRGLRWKTLLGADLDKLEGN